jgi:hypothetical protein
MVGFDVSPLVGVVAMTALLNPKVWLAIALAAAMAFSHFFVYRSGKSTVRNEFDAYKISQQEARILADRAREQRYAVRQAATDEEARNGQAKIAALETDLAGARAAGERLRDAIRTASGRGREAAGTAGSGEGKPGSDPIGLFAELLVRADARAERVSEYADRLAIAGKTCERYADRLQPEAKVK